ncbi:hypothetical protein Pla108_41030 [Botrimarina colliarenosi]|uniref:Uncharacterized protein n=1 Tax=Botrimarina colliarenosi TaxID=2528001 RepID=A0A5C5ZZI9_9BACT|nr:hypothetical protein [Botrimarina colliarenosi]TWT92477.1 hypothetical protein Pla108_41030 [Botrimarina colliarenosi]
MELLPLLAEVNRFVYAPFLLAAVSLVYAGTRHEDLGAILRHAGSFGAWTVAFMVAVAAVIQVMALFQ